METIYVSTDGWMDKENVVHIYAQCDIIQLSINGNSAISNNMDAP